MNDFYLYQNTSILKNKLNIRSQEALEQAEADYVSLRLRQLAQNPLEGNYDSYHFCCIHEFIFQDIYDWAGEYRKLDIYKEEPVLGGLSVDYSKSGVIEDDVDTVLKEMNACTWKNMNKDEVVEKFALYMGRLWKIHPFREGNTRTVITFCCQYMEYLGFEIDREIYETNSMYVRNALVAYNAVFDDLGDLSKKEYLLKIVYESIEL